MENANTALLFKDTKNMTREEKIRHAQELEFEALAIRNKWEGDEKELNKRKFFEEKERNKKLLASSVKVLTGQEEKLTAFEKKQAEKYMKENPEIENIFNGIVDMISE